MFNEKIPIKEVPILVLVAISLMIGIPLMMYFLIGAIKFALWANGWGCK